VKRDFKKKERKKVTFPWLVNPRYCAFRQKAMTN
jgi:hypothetical protein